MIGAQMFQ